MEIEYIDATHTYLADGVIVPSVTQIVNWYLGEPYRDVPKNILRESATYGTTVHEAIEKCATNGNFDPRFGAEIAEWERLNESVDIKVTDTEQIVYSDLGYAGRYDMKGLINGRPALIDIKTTSKLNKDALALQMGLYKLALGEELECYCVWMPRGGEAGLVPIKAMTKDRCEMIVKRYISHINTPTLNENVNEVQIYTEEETFKIKQFLALKTQVEKIEADGKHRALEYMKANGIKTFENDLFKITYIEASEKRSVDTDRLKMDGLYDQYTKTTPVKESVRITWRNQS